MEGLVLAQSPVIMLAEVVVVGQLLLVQRVLQRVVLFHPQSVEPLLLGVMAALGQQQLLQVTLFITLVAVVAVLV
jgi:hypothetical protein